MKQNCGIYKITNIVTGDFYIGQSVDLGRRKSDHFSLMKNGKGKQPHLQNAWSKHGGDNFLFETVLYCEPFELTRYEQASVDRMKPAYNICRECVESTRGIKHTEEQNRKNSESHVGSTNGLGSTGFLGHKHTAEALERMRAAHKGKVVSAATRLKLSLAGQGNTNSLGYKHSPETLANMSGRVVSAEVRATMSEAGKLCWAARRIAEAQGVQLIGE